MNAMSIFVFMTRGCLEHSACTPGSFIYIFRDVGTDAFKFLVRFRAIVFSD
jgi:hypothetical protein